MMLCARERMNARRESSVVRLERRVRSVLDGGDRRVGEDNEEKRWIIDVHRERVVVRLEKPQGGRSQSVVVYERHRGGRLGIEVVRLDV